MTLKKAIREKLVSEEDVRAWAAIYSQKHGRIPCDPFKSDRIARIRFWFLLIAAAVFLTGFVMTVVWFQIGFGLLVMLLALVLVEVIDVVIKPDGSHKVFLRDWFDLKDMTFIGKMVRVDELAELKKSVLGEAQSKLKVYAFAVCEHEAALRKEKGSPSLDYAGFLHSCRSNAKEKFEELYEQCGKFIDLRPKESFYNNVKNLLD